MCCFVVLVQLLLGPKLEKKSDLKGFIKRHPHLKRFFGFFGRLEHLEFGQKFFPFEFLRFDWG